jgi:hypothetical protein
VLEVGEDHEGEGSPGLTASVVGRGDRLVATLSPPPLDETIAGDLMIDAVNVALEAAKEVEGLEEIPDNVSTSRPRGAVKAIWLGDCRSMP